MEITLSRVVEAARQRRAAVTANVGGYIVLLAAPRLAAHPCQITPDLIGLSAAGEVLLASGTPADPLETERGLRQLLRELLALSHAAPPALRAASERVATGDLAAFERELAAALIPLNHGASGRALARLFRETQRASHAQPSVGPASAEPSSPAPASVSVASQRAPATPLPVSASAPAATPAPKALTPVPMALTPAASTSVTPAPMASTPAAAMQLTPAPAAQLLQTPLTPASMKLTPLPAPSAPAFAVPAEDEDADLEIDVDVDLVLADSAGGAADDVDLSVDELDASSVELDLLLASEAIETTPALAPVAASDTPSLPGTGLEDAQLVESPLPPASAPIVHADLELPPQRSDLRELLNGYLAHTRSAENMSRDLRRLIGL
jgi:hypothetical protein